MSEAHLFLNDGLGFGKGGDGHARINIACPRYMLDTAMDRLLVAAKGRGLI